MSVPSTLTHRSPTRNWSLFSETIRRVGDVPVLVEWDNDIPPLERVLDEADRARHLLLEERAKVA